MSAPFGYIIRYKCCEFNLSNTERMRSAAKCLQPCSMLGCDQPKQARIQPAGAPRSRDPMTSSNPGMLGTEEPGEMPVTSTPRSEVSRRITAAERPVGNVLYLVLIGAVAIAIIGVFFGSGFLLLAPPAKETVADAGARDGKSPRPHGGAPRADGEAALVSREMAVPQSTAVAAAVPGSPLAQPATVAKAAPPQRATRPSFPGAEQRGPSQTASERRRHQARWTQPLHRRGRLARAHPRHKTPCCPAG